MYALCKNFIAYHFGKTDKQKYIELGEACKCSSFKVYRILRGMKCRTDNDLRVLYSLQHKGVISRISRRK